MVFYYLKYLKQILMIIYLKRNILKLKINREEGIVVLFLFFCYNMEEKRGDFYDYC